MSLEANTVVEVQSKVTLPADVEGLAPHAYSARLISGRIDVTIDMKRRPLNGVMISGPRKTNVLARGGHVAIVAGPMGVAIGVYDGKEASVGIGSTWKTVPPGNMIVVSPQVPGGMESKLPPPPARVATSGIVLALNGAPEPTRATWAAVPRSTRYIVHLVDMDTSAATRLEVTEPAVVLDGLNPGSYAVRVASAERFGLDGVASQPAFVKVVGLELPTGAIMSEGKVYLDPTQHIVLSKADGVEVAYDDDTSTYVAAPSRVSLRGTRATRLHLRAHGTNESKTVDLVPRALATEIALSPATPHWPRDKISIRIRLPKVLERLPQIELTPNVTVNNQPVAIKWLRNQGSLNAVIPRPPVYPGPWVLRTVVTDQHGVVLGRNVLEIAAMEEVGDEDLPRETHRHP